ARVLRAERVRAIRGAGHVRGDRRHHRARRGRGAAHHVRRTAAHLDRSPAVSEALIARRSRGGGRVGTRVVAVVSAPVVLVAVWWLVAFLADSTVVVGPVEAMQQVFDLLASPRYRS